MAQKAKKRMAEGLIEGLKDAVAHERGEKKLRTTEIEIPGPAPKWTSNQIRKLRKEIYEMSQTTFAATLNVTASTVRAWEQGQKTPSGAAARLLEILEKDQTILDKIA